jgi:hypothetical protein
VKRAVKITIWVVLGLAFAGASAYTTLGLYVMPPKDQPPDGVTILYNRAGTFMPFVSSPDSRLERENMAVNKGLMPIAPRSERIIARFPFNKKLYLKTTGNVEFLK